MLKERLIKLRKTKRLTQQDLADLCKVSRNSIVNWETGKREPKIGDIKRIAEVLGVSPNELLNDASELSNTPIELQPYKKQSSDIKGIAYWGGIVDEARKVAESKDLQEIMIIMPLLKSALDILVLTQEQMIKTSLTQHEIPALTNMPVIVGHHNENNLTVETA